MLISTSADHLISPSSSLKRYALPFFHLPTTVISNFSIVTPKTKNDPSPFLFIGRLTKEKGAHLAFRAMKELLGKELLIVGDGPEMKNLERLVVRLGLDGQVTFLGSIPNNKLSSYYKQAFAVLMPSIWMENNPLVAFEALNAAVPIIASDQGGFPDLIVHEETGYLFTPGDVHDLARCMRKVSRPALSKKLGLAGRKRMLREYTAKKHYEEHMKVYMTLMS